MDESKGLNKPREVCRHDAQTLSGASLAMLVVVSGLLLVGVSCNSLSPSHVPEVESTAVGPTLGSGLPAPSAPSVGVPIIAVDLPTITRDNASSVQIIARIGDGLARDAAWINQDASVLVASTAGLLRFDGPTFLPEGTTSPSTGARGVAVDQIHHNTAVAGLDGTIRVYGPDATTLVHEIEGDPLSGLALDYSPDGAYLAIASVGSVDLWRTQDWEVAWTAEASIASCVAFDGTAGRVAICDLGSVAIRDLMTGAELYRLDMKGEQVYDAEFSPSGDMLALAAERSGVTGMRLGPGAEYPKFAISPEASSAISFDPSGSMLAIGTLEGQVVLVERETGSMIWEMAAHEEYVARLAFSPDGGAVLSVGGEGRASIWRAEDGSQVKEMVTPLGGVMRVAFSPSGAALAAAHNMGTVRIWDLRGTAPVRLLDYIDKGAWPSFLEFSADGDSLVSAAKGSAVVWNPLDGSIKRQFQIPYSEAYGHRAASSAAIAPDGRALAIGTDGEVEIWNTGTGQLVRSVEVDGTVAIVAFSPMGEYLVVGIVGSVSSVEIWKGDGGSVVTALEGLSDGVRSVAFSPDGTLLVVADGRGRVARYQTGEWTMLSETQVSLDPGADLESLVVNPAGDLFASGTNDDGAICLWDAVTGEKLHCEQTPDSFWNGGFGCRATCLTGLAFSLDGGILAVGSYDGSILLFGVQG